jgi:hypothetical protein
MNCDLTINDFKLNETFKKSFKNKLEKLLDVSPSDSGASSNITKTVSGYFGKLQIASSQGKFIVSSAGHDLEEMLRNLFSLMHTQVTTWRTKRLF